jgi:hypothetical protein
MIPKEIHNKQLPGCSKCNRRCQFGGAVSSSSGPEFKSGIIYYYRCNAYSRISGEMYYFSKK